MDKEQKISTIIFKERKTFFFAIIFAIIASIAITFLIPKKYSSFTIIYPAKSNSLKDAAIDPDFGYDIHADRIIQLIESQILQDSLVNKFKLLDYYELDKSENDWHYKLNKFLARDIDINRTRYLSIVIDVSTEDPELSANIANYIAKTVDIVKENMLKDNTKMAVQVFDAKCKKQTIKVDSLLSLLFSFSDKNKGSNRNNSLFEKRNQEIKERQKEGFFTDADAAIFNISPKNQTQQTERLINEYFHERGILYDTKEKYENSKESLNTPMPKSYIVSEAVPDYKKVSPSLRANLLIAIGVGILSALLLIIIKYKFKEIKEELS